MSRGRLDVNQGSLYPALQRLEHRGDIESRPGSGGFTAIVVSQSFASRLWPGTSAVGRHARYGSVSGPDVTVVGVVADAKFAAVGEVTPRR
jgi:hypothetical protein